MSNPEEQKEEKRKKHIEYMMVKKYKCNFCNKTLALNQKTFHKKSVHHKLHINEHIIQSALKFINITKTENIADMKEELIKILTKDIKSLM